MLYSIARVFLSNSFLNCLVTHRFAIKSQCMKIPAIVTISSSIFVHRNRLVVGFLISNEVQFLPKCSSPSQFILFCLVCTIWISMEYILRLITSPHRWLTIISLLNIFDFVILCSGWCSIILIEWNILEQNENDRFLSIKLFQYLIILRLFRFFRLCRYIKSLRIIFYGIERALKNIMSIGFILLFFVFTFGVIIEIIEKSWHRASVTRLEDLFNIVTISTITVGDAKRVPISPIGKILCAFLAGIGN